jgi:hypothetical protein
MSLTYYNLSEDWGWYIDVESMKPVYQITTDFVIMPHKKFNINYNKLESIEEDEYEYYLDNQKILDDISIIKKDENMADKKQNIISNNLIKFTSTTMITALITYIVFYIL